MDAARFSGLEERIMHAGSPGIRPGLSRMSRLMRIIGNPERKCPSVLVVGTNGKGSTCATLESIFRASGYRTALYTSPHLECLSERVLIDGCHVPFGEWEESWRVVEDGLLGDLRLCSDPPSYFELLTALAFLMISRQSPDVAVIEAGMGGRLDATNVSGCVEAVVCTPIGLDHQEYLGDTIEQIGAEKFATIRPGKSAVYGGFELREMFASRCRTVGAVPLFAQEPSGVEVDLNGTSFVYKGLPYRTPLVGGFQAENSALAIEAAYALAPEYPRLTADTIRAGVSDTGWGGRFEVLMAHGRTVILDGGHNAHGVRAVCDTMRSLGLDRCRVSVMFAAMKDKDYRQSLNELQEVASGIFCTSLGFGRCACAQDIERAARNAGWDEPYVSDDLYEALRAALRSSEYLLVCGSLYLVGRVRPLILECGHDI